MGTKVKPKKILTNEDIGELKPKEAELIFMIRNRFRWGTIEIDVKNGEPFRILKAYDTHALGIDDVD